MKKKSTYNIAVVGVGAVGEEMLRVLHSREFPIHELKVFARHSRDITVDNKMYAVKEVTPESFANVDIALFAGTEGDKGAAVTYAPEVVKRGGVVIDNGADFRMEKKVPLVVPEVNPGDIKKHKGIIANPNCSTIQLVVALWPIYKKYGLKRVVVTTLQAASGAGRSAINQLNKENSAVAASGYKNARVFGVERSMPQQLGYNVFPHIGSFGELDHTSEEWKIIKESQKIMHAPKLKISATTVRVPVRTGHSESVYIETARNAKPEAVKKLLAGFGGIVVQDDPKNNLYPMPNDAEGKDEVFVGRIRKDPYIKNGLWLWVVADNLRKGAATNAVQIAECLIGK